MGSREIKLDAREIDYFNECAIEIFGDPWVLNSIITFFSFNTDLYYEGKKWGFSDTAVREDICDRLLEMKRGY